MEKYYAIPEKLLPSDIKKIGKLTGWKKEVVNLLLIRNEDDETIKEKIGLIIKTDELSQKTITDFIDILPKNIRNKAKIFIHYLKKLVNIDEDGLIVYPDGEIGNSLLDHVKFWCTSEKINSRKLDDTPKMAQLLEVNKVPLAAFGSGKLPHNYLRKSTWLQSE